MCCLPPCQCPSLPTLLSWFQRGLVIGVKYAVSDHAVALTNSQWLLDQEPRLKLYTGSDALFKELAGKEGFHPNSNASSPDDKVYRYYGLTSIVGNICPNFMGKTVLRLIGAGVESDSASCDGTTASCEQTQDSDSFEAGCAMHDEIMQLIRSVIVNTTIPVGIKHALKLRGVAAGVGRRPVGILSAVKEAEIAVAVENTRTLV